MPENSFKKLLEEESREVNEKHKLQINQVQGGIWQSLGFFRLVGDIVDVYIPRLLEVFIMAAGGNASSSKKTSHPSTPSDGKSSKGPSGPADKEQIDRRNS